MQYPSFTRIWVRIVFLLSSFKASLFLSKDNGPFSPLPPSTIDFFIKYTDYLITHECDLSFGLLSSSDKKPLYFVIWRVAAWQQYIRRHPRPEDDDRNGVDEHRNDDDNDYDNDDHCRAVETIAGESDGAYYYLALFANRTIRYGVAVMV